MRVFFSGANSLRPPLPPILGVMVVAWSTAGDGWNFVGNCSVRRLILGRDSFILFIVLSI